MMFNSAAQREDAPLAVMAANADAPPRIHLDANANAPATRAVKEAVMAALEDGANPSSGHAAGNAARVTLVQARDAVAELCSGVFSENIVFTSGCTEANNQVVASARRRSAVFITSQIEHPSILRPAEAYQADGGQVVFLPVDPAGQVDLHCLEAALKSASGAAVVSIQAANSETGVCQPMGEIAERVRRHRDALFHSDAAQAFGKSALEIGAFGADVMSVSGHKLHGPMGVGALLLREDEERLSAMMLGGDQEASLRAGTQAMPLIAGFAAACRERAANLAADVQRMRQLRDRFEANVREVVPSVAINGAASPRLPNTSNIQFEGVDAMSMIALLDAEGVLCSQGSACHSRRPEPSPVLMAMGLSEAQAFGSVRFSVSPLNTEAEIDRAASLVADVCRRLGRPS